MTKHAVVRTDKMYGTNVRSGLVSVVYLGSDGETPGEIENGNVLTLDGLKDDEREIYVGKDVQAGDSLDDVVLIATPEVLYDEHKKGLDTYTNEAGKILRGYRLHDGDIFSVTKEAFADADEISVGDIVELADGTKLNVADAATEGSTTVGTILETPAGGKSAAGLDYYTVQVAGNDAVSEPKPEPKPDPKPAASVPSQDTDNYGQLGKKISDLISADTKIGTDGGVTGTLKYISGWTQFSSNSGENSGNFFPLKLDDQYKDKPITVKRDSEGTGKTATDLEWVLRVQSTSTKFTFEADSKVILTLTFTGATLKTQNGEDDS